MAITSVSTILAASKKTACHQYVSTSTLGVSPVTLEVIFFVTLDPRSRFISAGVPAPVTVTAVMLLVLVTAQERGAPVN